MSIAAPTDKHPTSLRQNATLNWLGDLLAHRYFDTSHSILQATVDYDIPALKDAILSLLQEPDKA